MIRHVSAVLLFAASAVATPQVTLYPRVNNIFGENGLDRNKTGTSILVGVMSSAAACETACLARDCFGFTYYDAAYPAATNRSGQCYVVTTSYYDWWPGFDQHSPQHVLSGRVWHGCKSGFDCANNGVCSSGTCTCRSGWKGPGCTELDLQPTTRDAGYQYSENGMNVSSWGGVPHQDEHGLFHMWVSQMTRHCGIIAWGENSIVVHTTSRSMLGPYKPANGSVEASTVFPVFSHEPDVKRAPTGEWVMFLSHCTQAGTARHPLGNCLPSRSTECICKDGNTLGPDDRDPPNGCIDYASPDINPTYMSYAASAWGPWSTPVPVVASGDSDSNLSPLIFKDGSLLGLWRSFTPDVANGSFSRIHTVTAKNWKDPGTYEYGHKPEWDRADLFDTMNAKGTLRGPTEDPYLFEDEVGNLHALFHNMYGCFPCCGHAFASGTPATAAHANATIAERLVAAQWTYTGGDACRQTIEFEDGGQGNLGRRERPHLLFDEKRRPLMLTNGGTYWPGFAPYGHDHSFTIAQPIAVK